MGLAYGSKVLRARRASERAILDCARELVERWGADPNVATGVGPGAGGSGGLTPLCVAAARGMATVTGYLLGAGADGGAVGAGSFHLWGDRHRSVRGAFSAAGWAAAMLEAEERAGVPEEQLSALRACLEALSNSKADEG